jgi:predicted metal-dependent hydrolase
MKLNEPTSLADELALGMYKNISSKVARANVQVNTFKEAIECLSEASRLLKNLGDKQASDIIALTIEKMAGKNV